MVWEFWRKRFEENRGNRKLRHLNPFEFFDHADVGMVQSGNGTSFAAKTVASLGLIRQMRGKDLDGDRAVQSCVTAAVDLAHAVCAEGERISYRPSFVPGASAIVGDGYTPGKA